MVLITYSNHALERVMERKKLKEGRAKHFLKFFFKNFYDKFTINKKHKGRDIRRWRPGNKYIMTDGRHYFIYERTLGEIHIITYYKRENSPY